MRVTRDSFTDVYEKYKNTVYSVIFNYVRNTDNASDVTQDVFMKLIDSDVTFDSEEHLKAWLIRVAINASKNLLKYNSRFSDEEIPEIPYFEEHNEDGHLLRLVMSLPEKYRVPLHLFYYEDLTIRQIGNLLHVPEATIKIRLKRGRDKLQKLINNEG